MIAVLSAQFVAAFEEMMGVNFPDKDPRSSTGGSDTGLGLTVALAENDCGAATFDVHCRPWSYDTCNDDAGPAASDLKVPAGGDVAEYSDPGVAGVHRDGVRGHLLGNQTRRWVGIFLGQDVDLAGNVRIAWLAALPSVPAARGVPERLIPSASDIELGHDECCTVWRKASRAFRDDQNRFTVIDHEPAGAGLRGAIYL